MNNVLDELFAAQVPTVPYALTFTDIDPSSRKPHVSLATGVMKFEKHIESGHVGSIGLYLINRRYIDYELTMWHGEGIKFKPTEMNHVTWPNALVLGGTPSAYYFRYYDKTHPISEAQFYPEVTEGGSFPGYPSLKTAVLVSKFWLGAAVLVLGLPDRKG